MTDLANLHAPTLADLEKLAYEAYERLPEAFRRLCDGVVVKVDDFPDDDTLREMECETPFDLLGLYRGGGITAEARGDTGTLPAMIFLYRRPLLDYWCETGETLRRVVRHVLIHEIGHHLGLSDEDIDRIEASVE